MKQFVTPLYTFTPGVSGVGTVNLYGIVSFNIKLLVAVINQTRGVVIYSTGSTDQRYTAVSGTTLTLNVDTSTHSSGDVLQVIYEAPDAQPVSGPLTDSQLRAAAVPVSGTVSANTGLLQPLTDAQLRASAVPVSGTVTANTGFTQPLTDTQLRAAAVPVSGPLTDAQLRAAALPVSGTFYPPTQPVSAASLPLPSGAATDALQTSGNASLANIDSDLGAPADAAATTDTGTFSIFAFIKRGLQNWTTLLARIPALVSGRIPVDGSGVTQPVSLAATVAVSGPLTDTQLRATAVPVSGTVTANTGLTQPLTDTQLRAAALPVSAASLPLPSGASTSAKQPALGTAGTASADVLTVQGIASMTALKVDGSAVTQPVSGTVTANIGTGSLAAGTNAIGDVGIQYRANATGAASRVHLVSAANTNATVVKSSAGRLLGYCLTNNNAAKVYLKFHNSSTTPTAGAGVVQTIGIPIGGTVVHTIDGGVAFSTGIAFTTVTTAPDNGSTGVALNDIVGDIFYA